MTSHGSIRRRPSVHITLQRAARLHRLVRFLAEGPRARTAILSELRIGLRTFYRELELLNRCGVKVRHKDKLYHLLPTAARGGGSLAVPRPPVELRRNGRTGPRATARPARGWPSCSPR